ncbi:TPA: hypothetical protein U0J94_001580 [Streptococcus suis]|nr:hypothetical protein EI218_01935 [Streptococcus suis]HEL1563220.1 hypothetical protein [Streptococcus suis]HEL1686057.1 hypothetical protein [Streptococcus suis]HEL1699392.1 hypothetical protein [Streptococcus suis]HEL1743446.1 hypothetical protein [Streptococcus suis]
MYSCNKWELDALLEGLNYRKLDEQEHLAELALNLRYTLNAKKVSPNKLSKKKQKEKVRKAFNVSMQLKQNKPTDMLARIEKLNAHFRNR